MTAFEGAAPQPVLELKDDLAAQMLDPANYYSRLANSIAIHNETVSSCKNFHKLFSDRHKEGKPVSEHSEQDLLRAILLFSCSGLDATIKQIVRENLELILSSDVGAIGQFKTFVERQMKRGADDERASGSNAAFDASLLAGVLISENPRVSLINILIRSLTSDSMQSRDQILKVAAHFALTKEDVLKAPKITQEAFVARNQLSHEMDVDISGTKMRRARSYADMVRWSENILEASENFIRKVSEKSELAAPAVA